MLVKIKRIFLFNECHLTINVRAEYSAKTIINTLKSVIYNFILRRLKKHIGLLDALGADDV